MKRVKNINYSLKSISQIWQFSIPELEHRIDAQFNRTQTYLMQTHDNLNLKHGFRECYY